MSMKVQGVMNLIEYLCSLVESRDFSAERHCQQIRRLTDIMLDKVMTFCPEFKLTNEERENISGAAAMHDAGKILISESILQKPSRLTEDETEIMRNHTRKGRKLFLHLAKEVEKDSEEYNFYMCCADVCMYHHERFDGSGYPEGLSGNDIPISAQVVGLVESYDALVSDRIYKPALDKEEAFDRIVEGECGVFNPRLMEIFRMVRMELEEVIDDVI